jgi:D-alanyl-D-alanine carboxypeptidase
VLVVLLAPDLTLAPVQQTLGVRTVPRQPAQPALATIDVAVIGALEAPRFPAALEAARATAGADRVTFAAVRDGRLLWSGSSGAGTTADSALVIGSVTKTFVAAAVLELVEAGRIGLDDTIGAILPAYPGVPGSVTIRQLLDHTSGIADVYNPITSASLEAEPDRGWSARTLFGTVQLPWHPPGAGWSYANANYYLLGLVVERVTGGSLADELQRRFFAPLGLEATRMLTAAEPEPLTPAWATVFWASGAMVSSAADLARWGDALYAGEVLEPPMRAAMRSFNAEDYGLGTQRITLAGRVGVGHTGLLDTYTALLLYLPDDGVTVALLVDRPEAPLEAMLTAAASGGGPSLLDLALAP